MTASKPSYIKQAPATQQQSFPSGERLRQGMPFNSKYPSSLNFRGKSQILVLGSSLTRGLLQEREPCAEVITFPGITTVQLARIIGNTDRTDNSRDPRTIVIHVGGNNLSQGQDPDEALGDHWYLIEQTKTLFPNSNIVMSGVLYRRGLPKRHVDNFNSNLRWVCEVMNVAFVEVSSALRRDMYRHDGVHLNQMGVATFSKLLRNFCEACLRLQVMMPQV